MKKNYLVAFLILMINFVNAQIEPTSYRGAFAPAPTAMWTNGWANFDPQNAVYPTTGFNIPTVITSNTTLFTGNTYLLQGLTYVKNGATLTIQPGVVIRGAAAGSGLVITKGSKINAVGTATSPIVFTSNKPVGSRSTGDWGGIIILGKGEFNQNNGVANVEGITASDDTQFGGGLTPDTNDNSGILKYVRIEFGGYEYSANNEINGLTMGAVGNGTTIDYVQVSHTKDDGFEWFGGSVNCKHLVSYRTLDDDFDTANGYSGTVQFALAIRDPQAADISGSEGFEGDNTSSEATGDATPGTTAIFTNCTLVGPTYRQTLANGGTLNSNHKKAVRLRRGSKLRVFNSIFMDFKEGLHIDGLLCEDHANNGDLIFKNNILAGITTTAKYIQVTTPATITAAGTGGAFNMTTWFTANANSNVTSSADLLESPYGNDATVYTGLDFRPKSGSIAETGANFTDASFTGLLFDSVASNGSIEFTNYRGAFAPAPTAMWTDNWTNYDPQNTVYPTAGTNVATEITTNTTWTTGNTYLLQGLTYVKNDATLTIQPGVTIRGAGVGSGLVITKGSKINAVGTATSPIVFTSNKPVGSRSTGDWGGIIILGKGEFNQNNGVANVEGITASDDTQFGGGLTPDTNDNSGILKYVRIEFGGYEYSANNEINGLTMGAVGNGTTIDYVQVSHTKDDGFEWFGGSVNCKHLVSYKTLDDDFDTANGYSGTVQFALAVRDPQAADVSGSEGFEGDNTSSEATGTATPGTTAIFTNCTLVGPTYRNTLPDGGTLNINHKKAVRLRRGSKLRVFNSIFMDFKEGLHIDGLLCEDHANNGDLIFKNNILAGITTTAKYIQVTTPATITAAGTGGAFNMTTWFTANANSNVTSSAGILTNPYNATSATIYTGLDYRPATNSIALSGSNFNGIIANSAPAVVSPISTCKGTPISLPSLVTLSNGAVSLKWYTSTTSAATSGVTTAPTVTSSKTVYVSQVYSDGTESPRASIVVTVNSLPTTPGSITGSTAISKFVATTTEFTYSIAAVANATSYLWTVPQGVNIVSGQGTNTLTVNFNNVAAGAATLGNITVQSINAAGCLSIAKYVTLKKVLPKAPSAIKMTDDELPIPTSGTPTAVKSFAKYMGTDTVLKVTAKASADATSYVWELPTGVNILNNSATTTNGVTSSASNVIEINFLNVTKENSTVGSSNVIRIGVKAKNGTGLSVTDNTALLDPVTTSTAKLLTLTATIPAAPSAIAMTEGSSTTKITDASKLIGETTPLTLTAKPSKLASSYSWELPAGVNIVSGATLVNDLVTSSTNVIVVNFASVQNSGNASLLALPIGVKAVNGIGSSITVNVAPNDASTAKILKVSAAKPNAISTLTGSTALIPTTGGTKTYTFAAAAKANTYVITAPEGCIVTTTGNTTNTSNTLETANLEFTVEFPSGYVSTTTANYKKINVVSKNGVGTSADKLFTIKSVAAAARYTQDDKEASLVSGVEMYPNPASDVVAINVIATTNGTVNVTIYSFDGTIVSESKDVRVATGVNSLTENVSKLNKGIYLVKITNSSSNEVITKKLIKN